MGREPIPFFSPNLVGLSSHAGLRILSGSSIKWPRDAQSHESQGTHSHSTPAFASRLACPCAADRGRGYIGSALAGPGYFAFVTPWTIRLPQVVIGTKVPVRCRRYSATLPPCFSSCSS